VVLPKHLQKYVLYTWLKNGSDSSEQFYKAFGNTTGNRKVASDNVSIPQELYKATKGVSTVTEDTSNLFYRVQTYSSAFKTSLNELTVLG
jgi:hypothetical protein